MRMKDRFEANEEQTGRKATTKREMSRRQFLAYTLGGTGGFMAAGMIAPMLRFAVDPVLKPKAKAEWIKVVEESKITEEPQSFTFKVHQVDGWYESDPEITTWIAKGSDGQIFALNPTCKHLGCTVGWNNNKEYKDQYFCPCHGAHYTKDGKNLAVAPKPLDQYDLKIEQGFVYLGELKANSRVK
ncbi:menaquinol-cytochrome c reductase iron-sulfur subunit QcrA [Paenibacillus larvae subsp. larvae]|nr:menaquinol-cytochrome c reductase iron-sulfur subunit QcrA [Paenibacillus larvae subsp. larvae]AVG11756.1 menaquinol-cytochrome c reductase iron-sulfur subunit QcrA [Paenibacillus larvae subsp. larvae DSM 25430]ETK25954.1 menaquinol-cytochrome c reductase iron-sulfur subunit QcrA [Paenibacillus larvae subsp. larvae DSM 25719]QHZ50957.1 menaquinol-cytochrome c reductase iron-sulfur subunit QcrA [Paenibacillus larvae subsp. larvae]